MTEIKIMDDAGKEISYQSDKCIVIGYILFTQQGKDHILLQKRGPSCVSEVGKWCVPGGHVDAADENAAEAMIREIKEECGLDINFLEKSYWMSHIYTGLFDGKAWDVTEEIIGDKKRLGISFGLHMGTYGHMPYIHNKYCEPGEVDEVKWVAIEEALKMDLGFDHNNSLQAFINFLKQK